MGSRASAIDGTARAATVLPVGKVSELLGIPAVTLRTWEARYGLGPSGRTSGSHRRYTSADIKRLRRVQQLIARGVSAGDAARLSLGGDATTGHPAHHTQRLLEAAESLAVTELTDILVECFLNWGAVETWTTLVSPAFRTLETRFGRTGDCTDIELVLAAAVTTSAERYLQLRKLSADRDRPILLVHSPAERHTLPLVVLRTALLERSRPVVVVGPDANERAVLQAIARTDPATVVLWATIRRPGQLKLRNRVRETGSPFLLAGPGWPAAAAPIEGLVAALEALTTPRHSTKF